MRGSGDRSEVRNSLNSSSGTRSRPWNEQVIFKNFFVIPGPEVKKLFFMLKSAETKIYLAQQNKFNVKMPTIVGILTFISRVNYKL